MQRPEIIMALAGLLLIIGAFGSWISWGTGAWGGNYSASISGWDIGSGKATLIMGLIMMYSSTVELGYVDIMEEIVPVLSTSAICGVVSLVLALGTWDSFAGGAWGLYLTIVASFIALFAAYLAYMKS